MQDVAQLLLRPKSVKQLQDVVQLLHHPKNMKVLFVLVASSRQSEDRVSDAESVGMPACVRPATQIVLVSTIQSTDSMS